MKPARILLADDHPLMLEGIRTVLTPHYEIVGVVTDGLALLEAANRLKPDLIVLDVAMPILNGIKAAAQIKKSLPETKLLFVTMHSSPTYLQAALHAGARGFVLKSSAREEILTALEKVLHGKIYITPSVGGEGAERAIPLPGARTEAALHLTPRERQVLQFIAEGRTNKDMAHLMRVSTKTVAFHRENIRRKLGLPSTAELTKYAIEEGLI